MLFSMILFDFTRNCHVQNMPVLIMHFLSSNEQQYEINSLIVSHMKMELHENQTGLHNI